MSKKLQADGPEPAKPPAIGRFAEALGLSKGRVSALWSAGMPRGSIADAQEWYRDNIAARVGRPGKPSTLTNQDGRAVSKVELECQKLVLDIRKREEEEAERHKRIVPTDRAKHLIAQVIDIQRRHYRMLEALYAQSFAITADQRQEWQKKWDTTEQQISQAISELQASLI